MLPEVGSQVYIQSFKHDGSLHRTWAKGFVIEAGPRRVIAVTNKTWVTEADGRRWFTREPAICFFYPDHWYNVITMIRKTGIYYYCNLASPSLYDGEAIKNIDYDLDVKLLPDGRIEILDEDEYEQHGREMGYSEPLKHAVEKEMDVLIGKIKRKESPFNQKEIECLYHEYLELLHATLQNPDREKL